MILWEDTDHHNEFSIVISNDLTRFDEIEFQTQLRTGLWATPSVVGVRGLGGGGLPGDPWFTLWPGSSFLFPVTAQTLSVGSTSFSSKTANCFDRVLGPTCGPF